MSAKSVAVLDIGSSKINATIGINGVNNIFVIQGSGECEYAGYYEGEFLEEDKLKSVLGKAVADAEASAGQTVSKLFVGVPADFCVCINKTITKTFGNKIKINQDFLTGLYAEANELYNNSDYVLLSCSPVCFTLDDGRKVVNSLGQKTTKITANLSLIYAEKTFIEKFNSILKQIGVSEVEYLCSSLCEATYLLKEDRRQEVALIIDCGYIATSVALVKGDGLVDLKSFAVGGAHIAADLSECLGVTFDEAEALRKQLIMSVVPTSHDDYEIIQKEKVVPVSMQKTNEIVGARLEMICSLIQKCVKEYGQEYQKIPYYLTGGGICFIKGCKEFMSKTLGVNVSILTPPDMHMSKPNYSSVLGLLNTALNQENKKKSIFEKITKIFNKQ